MSGDEPEVEDEAILLTVGPADVRALQAELRAGFERARAALQRCAAAGTFTPDKTPDDWKAWASFKVRALAYLLEVASVASTFEQYERGEALATDVSTWSALAKQLGDKGAQLATVRGQAAGFAGLGDMGPLVLIYLLWRFGKKGR